MNRGFTLIELVVIIVILGILSAVAIPKYISLEDEAQNSTGEALVGAIESASMINYSAYKAGSHDYLAFDKTASCAQVVFDDALKTGLLTTPINKNRYAITNSGILYLVDLVGCQLTVVKTGKVIPFTLLATKPTSQQVSQA